MRFPNWHHKILTLATPGLLFIGLLFIGVRAYAVDSTTANVQAGGVATLHVDTQLDATESASAAQLHKLQ